MECLKIVGNGIIDQPIVIFVCGKLVRARDREVNVSSTGSFPSYVQMSTTLTSRIVENADNLSSIHVLSHRNAWLHVEVDREIMITVTLNPGVITRWRGFPLKQPG